MSEADFQALGDQLFSYLQGVMPNMLAKAALGIAKHLFDDFAPTIYSWFHSKGLIAKP